MMTPVAHQSRARSGGNKGTMTRSLERAKRRISRALDQQQSLSRRLQSAIERTESLQTFRDQSLQLADRLRAESAEWVSTHQRDCLKRPPLSGLARLVKWRRQTGPVSPAGCGVQCWRLPCCWRSCVPFLGNSSSGNRPRHRWLMSVDPSAVAASAMRRNRPPSNWPVCPFLSRTFLGVGGVIHLRRVA